MKSFIVFALFVAAAVALPLTPSDEKNAETIRYEIDNIGLKGYNFELETSDGKKVSEKAVLKNEGLENQGLEVRGSYSYFGNDGILYTVTYVADELGYRASGDHLPK